MQSYITIQYTVWCKKWDPRCSPISIFNIQCGAKTWDLRCSHISIFNIKCGAKKCGTLDAVIYQYSIYSVVQKSGTLDAVSKFLYEGSHFFWATLYIFITHVFVFIHQINFLAFQSLHNDVADRRGNFDFLTQTGQQIASEDAPWWQVEERSSGTR